MITRIGCAFLFLLVFFSIPSLAWIELSDRGRTLQMSGQAVFTQEASLRPAYPLQASLTVMPFERRIVLGITGQHWLTPLSLKMTTLGSLVGFQWGNPRIRYRFLVSAYTPLGTESGLGKRPLWEAKFQSLLKFNKIFSWILEVGYLYTKNSEQKWTGPLLGSGIGIHF